MTSTDNRKLPLVSNPIQLINPALSGCIEHATSSSRFLRQLLKLHGDKLRICYDAYPSRSSKSRSAINTGKVTLKDGDSVTVSSRLKENVIQLSDALDLDEVDTLILWLQFNHPSLTQQNDWADPKKSESKIALSEEAIDEEKLAKFTAFYFEERRSALIAVAAMLHIEDNESSPIFNICLEFLNSVFSLETPSLILQNFTKRTKAILPDAVRGSPKQSTFWAHQLVFEQKLVLEVAFLLFYGRIRPDASHYLSALSVLKDTVWGQNQACLAYFDEETSTINTDVSNLLTLITLQVSHIEDISSQNYSLASEPPSNNALTNPNRLRELYDLQLELLELYPRRAAPIALAWTFVLHRLTSIYQDNGIPPSHLQFAELILPSTPIQHDQHNENLSDDSTALYQRWARHILSSECQLFQHLSELATSVSSAGSHDPSGASANNTLGYLVTIRVLLSAIPIFFRLSYLGEQQFESAINTFALLFRLDAQQAIASEFWKAVRGQLEDISEFDLPLATGEAEYLEAVRSRFPVNFSLFTKMCQSLSGFSEVRRSSNSNNQSFCVESLLEYAQNLATLTEALSNTQSSLLPLNFEPTFPLDGSDTENGGNQGWIRASRPIWIAPGIVIPKDTIGKVVSDLDQNPVVVCWDFTWSAWQYWGSLIINYAGFCTSQGPQEDVFEATTPSNSSWAEGKSEVDYMVDMLKILTSVLECRPDLGPKLIHRMVGEASHQIFVRAIFNIIETSLDVNSHESQSAATQAALRLVSALLPIFPNDVWTLVRGSQAVFPTLSKATAWNVVDSSCTTLRSERLSGRYDVTLALLDLAQILILEATTSGIATSHTFAQTKTEVLLRALRWICEEVWPGFQSWKYVRLEDKFKIASKSSNIFNVIATEALKTHFYLPTLTTDLVAARLIESFIQCFIQAPTAITLNPMITIIRTNRDVMNVLAKSYRHIELEALTESLASSLSLAKNILALKPHYLSGDTPSLLERLLLSQSSKKTSSRPGTHELSRQSVLPFIAQWCLNGPHTEISRNACDIFALLCTLSKDWPSDWPSISTAFGDPSAMNRFLHELARQASDPGSGGDGSLRSAFWDLLAVILETQPALAAILVTGSTSLPGATRKSLDSELKTPTPLELGIRCFVKCFENNDELNLAVGLSVLYFLYTIYSRVNGFIFILNKTMEDQAFVDRIVSITTSLIISPQALLQLYMDHTTNNESGIVEELQVRHFCNELICKAYSTRVLTVLLELEIEIMDSEESSPTKRSVQTALLEEFQKTPGRLSELVCSAIETMADPQLQSNALGEISHQFPNLDLDAYRRVDSILAYEKLRLYGKGFVYDHELMKCRIEGSDVSSGVLNDVLRNLVAINWNLSVVDAQLEVTKSWEMLLEVAFQHKNIIDPLRVHIPKTLLVSANLIADEDRGGDFMVHIHSLRISIFLTLSQALPLSAETTTTTIRLLENVKDLISSERFPILHSIQNKVKVTWHTDLLKVFYMVLRRCTFIDMSKSIDGERRTLVSMVETLLRSSILILEAILTLAQTHDPRYEQDLNLSVSIFSELMNSPVRPPILNWAHRIHDLCQPAFNLLNPDSTSDDQDARFAQDIIRLFMSLALEDRLAEYLASEGLVPVLLNLSLTSRAARGSIEPVSAQRPSERNPIHRLWCSVLMLVTSLANTLCDSELFMLEEIGAFARLYSPQLLRALSSISVPDMMSRGSSCPSLTLAGIEEMELVSSFLLVISSKPIRSPHIALPENYRLVILVALQNLAHCLNHPNSTSKWLENDMSWKNGLSLEISDSKNLLIFDNGPSLAPHVQKSLLHMLQTSRNILQTLISHTKSFNVLTQEVTEWALELAILNPSRSIIAGDPASIGTLFELAETCLDIYRQSSNPTQLLSITSSSETDSSCAHHVAAGVLESALLLASTQLALWLYSSMSSRSSSGNNMAVISSNPNASKDNEIIAVTQASTYNPTSPRLKREILSDMAPDLIGSIEKTLHTVKSISSRTSVNKSITGTQGMQSLRESVSFKKKRSLRSSSSMPSNEGNKEIKNGVEEILGVLRSFVERFLHSSVV